MTRPSDYIPFPRRRVFVGVNWISYDMLSGIARYAKQAGWWLDLDMALNSRPPPERWDGDGIIGIVGNNQSLQRLIEVSGVPAVNLALDPPDLPCCRVVTDHQAIADMAAKHLLERHFRSFATFRFTYSGTEQRRLDRFIHLVAARDFPCPVFKGLVPKADKQVVAGQVERLAAFLKTIPRPFGAFCTEDDHAKLVLEAALLAGLDVPDHIAVLGVNNVHLVCDFVEPPLSSIDSCQELLGYQGAAMLERLMDNRTTPPLTLIAPAGVVTRRSTEIWATSDPVALKALKHIWRDFARPLQVADVARKVGLSKVALNNRFQRAFGTGVGAEIARRRIEEACVMLTKKQMNASEVYKRVGFGNLETFSRAFKRLTGRTATAYRLAGGAEGDGETTAAKWKG